MGQLFSRMKKTPVTSRQPDPLVAAAEAMPAKERRGKTIATPRAGTKKKLTRKHGWTIDR